MRRRNILVFIIFLLITAAIPSCKSPISPSPAGPTLSLILPDSARAFDSLTLRVHYSDSIKPTWDYAWEFGDSTKASTRDTSISHSYDSAGTYTIQVALMDTALHQTIAKQSGQIKIMPLNAPTLTLIVPDTNYWGDSCVMSVSSSHPVEPGWKFSWSLGDSTTVTGTNAVLHYYLTPGNYKVIVSLNDTVHHVLLASKSAIVPVVARHFNLALLQSMPYVDVDFFGKFEVTTSGFRPPFVDTGILLFSGEPVWSIDTFYENLYNSSSDTITANGQLQINESFENGGAGGYVNPNNPATANFSESVSDDYGTEYPNDVGASTYSTYSRGMGFNGLPFKNQNDSEIVFEATGPLLINPVFSEHQSFDGRAAGSGTTDISIDWTDMSVKPYVIIRFHK